MIDDADHEICSQMRWYKSKGGYVVANIWTSKVRSMITLHRFLMQPQKGLHVDHINRNKLDNRRKNLRCVDQGINNFNLHGADKRSKTGIRGVWKRTNCSTWRAIATFRGKTLRSSHKTIEEATKAVKLHRKELWEKYA